MVDLNKHWDGVDFNNRHIIEGLDKRKIESHIGNFNEFYIKHINTDNINSSLDWGCGGGLLAKELKKFSNEVYTVDISTHSLESCKIYAEPTETFLLTTDPKDINLPKVDLVLANAIVWHFPSLDYYKAVVDKWVELEPEYIVFNTKKSDKTTETSNYKVEFLNALFLADEDVEELFESKQYELVHKAQPTNTTKPSTYFVFKKK